MGLFSRRQEPVVPPAEETTAQDQFQSVEVNLEKQEEITSILEDAMSKYEQEARKLMDLQQPPVDPGHRIITYLFPTPIDRAQPWTARLKELRVVLGEPQFENSGKNQPRVFKGHNGSVVVNVIVTPTKNPDKESYPVKNHDGGSANQPHEIIRGDFTVRVIDKKTGTILLDKVIENIGGGIVARSDDPAATGEAKRTMFREVSTEAPDYFDRK